MLLWNIDCPCNATSLQPHSRHYSSARPGIGHRSSALVIRRRPWKRSMPPASMFSHLQDFQSLGGRVTRRMLEKTPKTWGEEARACHGERSSRRAIAIRAMLVQILAMRPRSAKFCGPLVSAFVRLGVEPVKLAGRSLKGRNQAPCRDYECRLNVDQLSTRCRLIVG